MSVEEFRVKGRERRVQGSERKRLALSSFNPRFCFRWHSLLLTLDFFFHWHFLLLTPGLKEESVRQEENVWVLNSKQAEDPECKVCIRLCLPKILPLTFSSHAGALPWMQRLHSGSSAWNFSECLRECRKCVSGSLRELSGNLGVKMVKGRVPQRVSERMSVRRECRVKRSGRI